MKRIVVVRYSDDDVVAILPFVKTGARLTKSELPQKYIWSSTSQKFKK